MHRLLKFTLDLFDVAPVFELGPRVRPKPVPEAPPKKNKAPSKRPKKTEVSTPPILPFSGDVFSRHPQASQHIRLQGHGVDYELLRSRRRTMTFSVSPTGLSVRAPFGMSQHSIEAAVQEKARWIVRKLGGMQQREERMAAQKMDWQAGARLAYLGGTLQVQVDPQAAQDALTSSDEAGDAWVLTLALPAAASDKKIRDATKKWLVQQATAHYPARMNHYAPLLNVKWRSLTLTNANTRWGSAKADGSIRLHWRLMQFSPELIDYVVAHELSHLRELNHSPRFWATVASVLPDYEARQKQLKAQVLPPWE
ncbi:MAG: SprT family zinc-dependent metalloprotease [Burkholderiaceae bacterium]